MDTEFAEKCVGRPQIRLPLWQRDNADNAPANLHAPKPLPRRKQERSTNPRDALDARQENPVVTPSWFFPPIAAGPPVGPSIRFRGQTQEVIAKHFIRPLRRSEGLDYNSNQQIVFYSPIFDDVRIYNQPDPKLTGYNPNEEHAVIESSLILGKMPNPPPAAFALRAGDLNVTTQDASYTSDPRVLVQYFDKSIGEYGMAVYEVDRTDTTIDAKPPLTITAASISPQNERDIVFVSPRHGLRSNEVVRVAFDGEFDGLQSGRNYYVSPLDSDRFSISADFGGAEIDRRGREFADR